MVQNNLLEYLIIKLYKIKHLYKSLLKRIDHKMNKLNFYLVFILIHIYILFIKIIFQINSLRIALKDAEA
jgi:hypothetical protein